MEDANWYLLQLKPNAHKTAVRNLKRQGFDTFLPLMKVTQRRGTRFIDSSRPLFPGYMFVKIAEGHTPWRSLNATLGVARLVYIGAKPRPLPAALMTELRGACDEDGLLAPQTLKPGDLVQIKTGPFSNFIATVEELTSTDRIKLLLEIMGQESRLAVAAHHVTRV